MRPIALRLIFAGDAAGRDGDLARAEVEAERQHLADVLDARLLVRRLVEAAAQRTTEGDQLQVVAAEQMAELAPAGFRQAVGRQVAGRVHLDAGDAEPAGLGQRARNGRPSDSRRTPILRRFMAIPDILRPRSGAGWVK